jgi:8-oxo-dGTP pyrophosphatase MutT (NUDIX family)
LAFQMNRKPSLFAAEDRQQLQEVLERAQAAPPQDWLILTLGHQDLGLISNERALAAAPLLPLVQKGPRLFWMAEGEGCEGRTEQLRLAAQALRESGWISGWRDEAYASWGTVEQPGTIGVNELFRMERAAFRFFGFRSHAVHVNGFTPDGQVWRARRAMSKATDPGMCDNLAAGGLSAGESVLSCAWRELHEEAGLTPKELMSLTHVGSIVTQRLEPEGWHSESLQVFNAVLKPGVTPVNQDGEVARFERLSVPEVMDSVRRGLWTPDAACAMAMGGLLLETPNKSSAYKFSES